MDFEWHAAKAEENVANTASTFRQLSGCFSIHIGLTRRDPNLLQGDAVQVIGMVGVQVLVVIYTPRADRIRII